LDLSKRTPAATRLDTVFNVRTATPGWLALRVDGVAGDRALLGLPAGAHTNAGGVLKDRAPRLSGVACGHMLDRVDALEAKLDVRRNWTAAWHEDTVEAVIRAARAQFGRAFTVRPAAFKLVPPPPGGAVRFDWSRAADPEP